MVIGFIEHLQIVTTLSLIHALSSSIQHVLCLLILLCLHQSLSGNGFQRRTSQVQENGSSDFEIEKV
jgi:hypothetical protein